MKWELTRFNRDTMQFDVAYIVTDKRIINSYRQEVKRRSLHYEVRYVIKIGKMYTHWAGDDSILKPSTLNDLHRIVTASWIVGKLINVKKNIPKELI